MDKLLSTNKSFILHLVTSIPILFNLQTLRASDPRIVQQFGDIFIVTFCQHNAF